MKKKLPVSKRCDGEVVVVVEQRSAGYAAAVGRDVEAEDVVFQREQLLIAGDVACEAAVAVGIGQRLAQVGGGAAAVFGADVGSEAPVGHFRIAQSGVGALDGAGHFTGAFGKREAHGGSAVFGCAGFVIDSTCREHKCGRSLTLGGGQRVGCKRALGLGGLFLLPVDCGGLLGFL